MSVQWCRGCGELFDAEHPADDHCSADCRQRTHQNLKPPKPLIRQAKTFSVAQAWVGLSELAAEDPPRHIDGTPRQQAR